MSETISRRPPAAVARDLRREAGFGCCVCGTPIIQYHHIIEWSVDQHFRTEDMMVLCPLHHDKASKGAMPEAEQRRWKAKPWNVTKGRVKGLLAVHQEYCAANFGTITWVGEGTCLRIDGQDILGFTLGEGNLEISLRLFNQAEELLLEIDRNEWISGDPLPWDIEADWQRITLRQKARDIAISIDAREVPLSILSQILAKWKMDILYQRWD